MSLINCSRKFPCSVSGIGIVLLALAVLVAGCSTGNKAATGTTPATSVQGASDGMPITLLESAHNDGPWARTLSRPLGKAGVPVQFYLCGVRGPTDPAKPCAATAPATLPAGATFRLEQQPVGPGVERADTPGWGIVATADSQTFQIVLSDFVSTNNKPAKVTYRATLRDKDGHILGTSNTVTVTWHR